MNKEGENVSEKKKKNNHKRRPKARIEDTGEQRHFFLTL